MSGVGDLGFGENELARAMFPDLAGALDAALARHGVDQPEAAFDAALAEAVDALPSAGFGGGAGTGEGGDGFPGEERLIAGIGDATRAFAPAGISVPEPEAFVAAGVDVAAIASALNRDPKLVPVIAPHGLAADEWIAAFAAVRDAPGVLFASEILRDFALLSDPPKDIPVVLAPGSAGTPTAWTLRAIPAGAGPAVLGLSQAHGPHPTLGEMLALQLTRASVGLAPVDRGTFTWLDPVIGGGRLAARHVYDAGEATIRISAREIGSQGPHQGARPPAAA